MASAAAAAAAPRGRPAEVPKPVADRPRRLGYKEQREWDQMETLILEAEQKLETCARAAHDPEIATDHEALHARIEALALAQAEVDRLYARWAELEGKVKA